MAKTIISVENQGECPQSERNLHFVKRDIDGAISRYNLEIEKAAKCPCIDPSTGSANTNCKNCGGRGWFFFDKYQTRGLLRATKSKVEFESWSEENRGTVFITIAEESRLSIMDRVSIIDAIDVYNEVVELKKLQDRHFASVIYPIKKVLDVFLFISSNEPLRRLDETEYVVVNANNIELVQQIDINAPTYRVSVRYECIPQYFIIDILRNLMLDDTENCFTLPEVSKLPLRLVGRRVHLNNTFIPFFEENKLLDNYVV